MERKLSILDAYTRIPKRIGVMIMAREEVKYASKDYVNYLLDKQEYHNENYTEYDIKQAFEKGAEWADEHPKNVWHDAGEEPRRNELLLGEDTDGFSIYRWCGQEDNWEAFVNETGLSRWAYIVDLLPKGGKK